MNCKQIILVLLLTTSVVVGYSMSADSTKVNGKRDSTFIIHSNSRVILAEESDILTERIDIVDSVEYYFKYVKALKDAIDKSQNFINTIDAATSFKLPVAISKKIAGQSYDIIIDAVRIKPTHAELDVVMQFDPPDGKTLIFMAKGIKISNKGGVIGDAKLMLISDVAINFGGDKTQLFIRGGSGHTYVTMDCDGFKDMSLDADVIFSRDLLIPENLDGTIQQEGRVKGSFKTTLSNWNDLIVQLTLPDFQVRGLDNFGFSIRNAVFDFSDMRNAPSVVFPKGYSSTSFLPDNSNLWRGIYVRELTVRLPDQLKSNEGSRTTLTANDLLIDNQGVSGVFTGRNLIALNNGNMNGWAYSLDSLSISLMANQIQEAGFKGDIIIPVASQQTPFHYTASIGENNNYLFTATAGKDMSFPIFATSKLDIYENSRLEVKIVDGKFLPKATLHGQMNIEAKLSERGKGVSLGDIRFENLVLQSEKPYIQVGFFTFGSNAAKQVLSGFPVQIQDVKMKNIGDKETGLSFEVKVNLVGEGGGGFAADSKLMMVGQMAVASEIQSWKFKQVDISSLVIDIDNGAAFKFHGAIAFYKGDVTYGDGFNGSINATFLEKLTVKGTAIFGSVNGERYWYVDAMVGFSPGIPVVGPIGFTGFGGGVYYGMRYDRSGKGSDLGKTESGIIYVPDVRNGMGFKATVEIGNIANPAAFNGDVTFEMVFFRTGGIRTISLAGNAYFASEKLTAGLDKLKGSVEKLADMMGSSDPSTVPEINHKNDLSAAERLHGGIGPAAGKRGQISARMFIEYDFESYTLHANFSAKIEVAGGLIKGGGDAVLHFASHEWYIYIGIPEERFNLSVGIGSIRASADAYFMIGTKIPGSPPPPEAVSRIVGGGNYDYMKDLNAIGEGAGFAFGTSFSVSTGELQFLIFYARFEAGAGFDIMIKEYGDTRCEGSNDRIGINGWYANGQAYAYFDGEVGIKVDLFFVSGKFKILSIGAAALLQTKLPNPTWFRGMVGGHFSILNGLVEGSCRFEVTLGSECKIVKQEENILSQIKVISQVTPTQGENEVNVFNSPQAVFNMPVEQTFTMNDASTQRSFRIKMDQFEFTVDGQEIAGTQTWNERHDVVAFNPIDVLPPRKEIKAIVQVTFEELKSGAWTTVTFQGKQVIEKSETSFKTGDAPDNIPLTNVEYSYPVIGQVNYYKNESSEGYIKLKQGQGYLFQPGAEWKQVGRFTTKAGKKVEFNFAYNSGAIGFSIPKDLSANELYLFELINVPVQKAGEVDRNVSDVKTQVTVGNQSTDTEIKTRKAEGSLTDLEEKAIFSSYFKASKYETFAKKIAAQNLSTTVRGLRILWRVHYLKTSYDIDEPFDKAELYGNEYTKSKPLVTFQADISDNKYYQQEVYPLVYEGYPLEGNITTTRNVDPLGIPPVGAVSVVQTPDNLEIDQTNPFEIPVGGTQQYYFYDLPNYMALDFSDIQAKVAQRYLTYKEKNPRIESILWGEFPVILKGPYKVNLQYRMPGRDGVRSSQQVILNNPMD